MSQLEEGLDEAEAEARESGNTDRAERARLARDKLCKGDVQLWPLGDNRGKTEPNYCSGDRTVWEFDKENETNAIYLNRLDFGADGRQPYCPPMLAGATAEIKRRAGADLLMHEMQHVTQDGRSFPEPPATTPPSVEREDWEVRRKRALCELIEIIDEQIFSWIQFGNALVARDPGQPVDPSWTAWGEYLVKIKEFLEKKKAEAQ